MMHADHHIHGRPEKVKPKKSNIDFVIIPILYDNDANRHICNDDSHEVNNDDKDNNDNNENNNDNNNNADPHEVNNGRDLPGIGWTAQTSISIPIWIGFDYMLLLSLL